MRHPITTACVLFPELLDRPLTATFDVPNASSDGGAVLLKAADRRLGLIPRLAGALVDGRQSGKVRHALVDLLGQRAYGLALGYEDANDAARLVDDAMHKLMLGRDPVRGDALASQPTLSRFENDVTRSELLRMSEALFETVLDRHARRRRIGRLQARLPKARILVRLDGGFADAGLFKLLDAIGVDYVVAMAKNKVLERKADLDMIAARVLSEHSGQTEHVFTDFTYKAGTWNRERRVVCKAEVVRLEGREPRLNARFVVTNLRGKPERIYRHVYCMRGEAENRIKELFDVALDRTSCTRFLANQFRVLLAAAAYVLMQELRLAARGTAWARAQVSTLRLDLLKVGVQVVASVRRLVLRLPATFPFREGWMKLALRLGASPG